MRFTHVIANSISLVANLPDIGQRAVSFSLFPTHIDKYSGAYRHQTPAQLQMERENTPWKQAPATRQWMERSCSKEWAGTLPIPANLRNNRFALLAEDNDDIDELPTTATA